MSCLVFPLFAQPRESYMLELDFKFEFELDFELDFELKKFFLKSN